MFFWNPERDQIQVTNLEDHPLELKSNSMPLVLLPGGTSVVTAHPIFLRWGNPNTGLEKRVLTRPGSTEKMSIPTRVDELKRLSVLYGSYDDPLPVLVSLIPRIEATVYRLFPEDAHAVGQRIVFPYEDPTCQSVLPPPTDLSDTAELRRQMELMQQRLDAYDALLRERQPVQDIREDVPPSQGYILTDDDMARAYQNTPPIDGIQDIEDTPTPARKPRRQAS